VARRIDPLRHDPSTPCRKRPRPISSSVLYSYRRDVFSRGALKQRCSWSGKSGVTDVSLVIERQAGHEYVSDATRHVRFSSMAIANSRQPARPLPSGLAVPVKNRCATPAALPVTVTLARPKQTEASAPGRKEAVGEPQKPRLLKLAEARLGRADERTGSSQPAPDSTRIVP
jgi:hypothetical protein